MLAEYKYIDDEPKEVVKPVTQVRFKVDYDITDICTRFGNWSRRGIYLRQNTPSYYQSQPKKLRELCSDNDAQLINSAFLEILRLNISNSKDIYEVLILFYFGEKQIITDYIVTDRSVRKEMARFAQNVHGAPAKSLSRGIRVDNIYIVKPLSLTAIAKKLEITWDFANQCKKSGEDFLRGYFASLKKNSGIELEIVKDRIIL